jgi:ribose 5-phosphate isomerase B
MEKLFIACDHGAWEEKDKLKDHLSSKYEVIDLGTTGSESVNYPDFGQALAKKVIETSGRGILLCGSGIGISIAANRFKGMRAALCRTEWDAKMSRAHNNSNVICFGGRVSALEDIIKMTDVWLSTEFEGGRHQNRIDLLDV